ncbi:MAG TPA: hypothetical protein PK530_18170, partial [Anaerolineales bacterium]|nr:hypothetical protein [Anaerolineales bacterium]
VAFESFATNLIPGGTEPFYKHVFVRDLAAEMTVLVSQSTTGVEANAWSQGTGISSDGRWIVFASMADLLVPGDTNFGQDIFVRDRDVDEDGVFDEFGEVATVRVSVDSSGGQMEGGQAYRGVISGDGSRIAFDADAADLVAGDDNFFSDVFLYGGTGAPVGSADLMLNFIPHASVLGRATTWNISLQNLGPDLAMDVGLNYFVTGENVYYYSWNTPSQGSCSQTGPMCTFGNVPNGSDVTLSLSASVTEDKDQVYQGTVAVALEATSSSIDPNPSNNQRTFATSFYECSARNGCPLDEIFCFLFAIPLEETGGFIPDLALYYHVRDGIMTSPTGQRYTDLYYTHSSEVSDLLFADDALWDLALNGLAQWEPNLTALVAGDGDAAVITTSQIQVLDDFLNALSTAGSPALQQAIADERANLPPLETFVGMTMDEARGEIVGYAVYMPVVQR